MTMLCLVVAGMLAFGTHAFAVSPAPEHDDVFNPNDLPSVQSPDFAETPVPGKYFGAVQKSFGNTASSAQQQRGALSGKIVYMNSGHGWTWDSGFTPPWRLQR